MSKKIALNNSSNDYKIDNDNIYPNIFSDLLFEYMLIEEKRNIMENEIIAKSSLDDECIIKISNTKKKKAKEDLERIKKLRDTQIEKLKPFL